MNPAVVYLGVGAIGTYLGVTGRLNELMDFSKRPDSSSQSAMQTRVEAPRPTIIVQPSSHRTNSYLLPLGCACFIGMGGYYYYIHNNGTKKVIGKVEETAEETQTLVQKTDENNTKRFEVLDTKNEQRAQDLELEIRGEQRAGFNVISEQLYCLTQVAIQTLSAVASSTGSAAGAQGQGQGGHAEQELSNEKLLGYCDKAQEMADTILSEQHMLKTKETNLADIKAEIQLRNNVLVHSSHKTPGGPDDDEHEQRTNPFDVNRNQSAYVTGISSKSYRDANEGDSAHDTLSPQLEALKLMHYAWANRQYAAGASASLCALWCLNKCMDRWQAADAPRTVQLYSSEL